MARNEAYYEAEKKIKQALKLDATQLEMINPTLHPKRNNPPPMPRDQAYYEAEKKIEEALKSGATGA